MTLISLATINKNRGEKPFYFLRKINPKLFRWFFQDQETSLEAIDLDEAFRLAYREWPDLQVIGCGYLFTLPERDEHGTPALFSEMVKSLESSNGIFFEEERGHNCIVHQIPLTTQKIYKDLKANHLL